MDQLKQIFGEQLYFLDFETDGFNGEVLEIGLYAPFDDSKNISSIIKRPIRNLSAAAVHGITPELVLAKGIPVKDAFQKLLDALGDKCTIVAHNCRYEYNILKRVYKQRVDNWTFLCTCKYAKYVNRNKIFNNCKLATLAEHFGYDEVRHRAFADSVSCYMILDKMIQIDGDLTLEKISKHMLLYGNVYDSQTKNGTTKVPPLADTKEFPSIDCILKEVKALLKTNLKTISFQCEVSEIRSYKSMYFLVLKDKTNYVDAIMWENNYSHKLEPGNTIKVIKGEVELFRSSIKVNIKEYQITGEGDITKQYQEMKKQLKAEGYMDIPKRSFNPYTRNIGIVSSKDAAGLQDFLKILHDRIADTNIYIYPCSVQGASAPKEIRKAIEDANRHSKADVLALIRGGGSKEDLWCFNDMDLAKSLPLSKIPIVTGIGHEVDETLCDLTADRSFITPTAVANSITYDKRQIIIRLLETKSFLDQQISAFIAGTQKTITDGIQLIEESMLDLKDQAKEEVRAHLKRMQSQLIEKQKQLAEKIQHELDHRIGLEMQENEILSRYKIETQREWLDTLRSGMCTLKVNGNLVTDSRDLDNLKGQELTIQFVDKEITVQI